MKRKSGYLKSIFFQTRLGVQKPLKWLVNKYNIQNDRFSVGADIIPDSVPSSWVPTLHLYKYRLRL
jgi:hypothetical protein